MKEKDKITLLSIEDIENVSGGTGDTCRTVTYKVKPRDTLESIAENYDVSVDDLCRWNRITRNADRLPYSLIIYLN